MRLRLTTYKIILMILIFSISSIASAELKIDSVYPTLGVIEEDMEVEVKGTGFDANTRVSMYLEAGNQRMLVGSVNTQDQAQDVFVSGSYAYVAEDYSGLQEPVCALL